jgi:hypothetical protein
MQMGRWLELARSIATHPHTRQRAGGCHGLQANWDSLQLQLTLILLLRDPKLQFVVRFPSSAASSSSSSASVDWRGGWEKKRSRLLMVASQSL